MKSIETKKDNQGLKWQLYFFRGLTFSAPKWHIVLHFIRKVGFDCKFLLFGGADFSAFIWPQSHCFLLHNTLVKWASKWSFSSWVNIYCDFYVTSGPIWPKTMKFVDILDFPAMYFFSKLSFFEVLEISFPSTKLNY